MTRRAVKWLPGIILPAVLMAMLLSACQNDMSKVRQISEKEFTNPVDSSITVEVTYSDSAHVKAVLKTPLLLNHNEAKPPFKEMPKGVHITIYNKNLGIDATIVSDYAITASKGGDQTDNLITLRKNVVVTNAEGDTFKSDELIWDHLKKLIYSDKPVVMNKIDGTILNYSNFKSNENGKDQRGDNGYGTIATKGNITQ